MLFKMHLFCLKGYSETLIEYNIRNIFLEKSYAKCGRETILKPFFKKNQN